MLIKVQLIAGVPNPLITMRETGRGAWAWPLRPFRIQPEGAACRGEAPPPAYLLVAYLHVIDGLEWVNAGVGTTLELEEHSALLWNVWRVLYSELG